MIDTQLLGETAARCMEDMDEAEHLDGGKLISVGITVIAEGPEGDSTFVKIYTSETMHYRQMGLYQAGLDCVKSGTRYSVGPDDDEDESDEE